MARLDPAARAFTPLSPPDPTLPAFDRILGLVQRFGQAPGGAGRRGDRRKRWREEVFEVLRDEGWLDHLRPGADGAAKRPGGGRPPRPAPGGTPAPPGADARPTPEAGDSR